MASTELPPPRLKPKEDAIAELVAPFVEHETYFTLVFGNHDHQQGVEKEELLEMYQKYGGKYCLAYDAAPDITGVANHNSLIARATGIYAGRNFWRLFYDFSVHLDIVAGNSLDDFRDIYVCRRSDFTGHEYHVVPATGFCSHSGIRIST